jgi:hypothetical protein
MRCAALGESCRPLKSFTSARNMRFLSRTVLKIAVLFIVLIVPVGLYIAFFTLNQRNIPIFNLGLRNLMITVRNLTLPIITVSFLLSTLFTVSLIDKMKVRSLFLLHFPALIIGAILLWVFYGTRMKEEPLQVKEQAVKLGYLSFFKEGVFNDLGKKKVLIKTETDNLYTVYIYDRSTGGLTILPKTSAGAKPRVAEKGRNSIIIDRKAKQLEFSSGRKSVLTLPFSDFQKKVNSINNPALRFYVQQLRKTITAIRSNATRLRGIDLSLFFSVFFLSVLMISIPLTYAMNDGGWGFSGITGVILILSLLPFFYGFILKILQGTSVGGSFFGRFSYLFPALVFCGIGIILDILIKVRGMKKGI